MRDGNRPPAVLLLFLFLWVSPFLWSPPAAGRVATGEATDRPRSILALERTAGERIVSRLAELRALEARRVALGDRILTAERRYRNLALRERHLERAEAAFARSFARTAEELEEIRTRLERRRLQRERMAAALLSRLHAGGRRDATERSRIRLLLGELLRDTGGEEAELRRLQERRRELARARAALSLARNGLAEARTARAEGLRSLRAELGRLALARQEVVRRLAAARDHRRELRRTALVARRLAGFAVGPDLRPVAAPPPSEVGPLRLATARDLGIRPRPVAVGPARLPSPSLPPWLSGAVVADAGPRSMLPVDGRILSRFGEESAGPLARGITIGVTGDRPVRAVRGGRVVFAQPFRRFGLVLILDHGDGYHTLLAGMTRLDVRRGDLIAAGAVVGRMGRSGREEGRLYVELRQRGRPVNPLPWLAARADRTRG